MKKIIAIAAGLAMLLLFASCTNDVTGPEPPPYTTTTATTAPEAPREHSLEELGGTIVAAGTFWEDWWSQRGAFASEHLAQGEALPEGLPENRTWVRVLPSSGFESLDGIRAYLLQYYTESWVEAALGGEFTSFAEYDGVLYMEGTRAGAARSNWETAEHALIEQEGGHAVVETTVMFGAWHRYPEMAEYMQPVQYRFTFVDGRIDSIEDPER